MSRRDTQPHVTTRGPLKDHYQVVVIGAGANGLGVARHLAEDGLTDILVLEKGYLLHGASGRNGGGIRAQWGTTDNLVLARESIRMFRTMSQELGFNIWFRQGGYLFLAHDEAKATALREATRFHNQHGVKSRYIGTDEIHALVPELNLTGITGASYHPDDGILFPWAVIHGLARRCTQLGVHVRTHTTLTGMERHTSKITRIHTDRGTLTCDWVINAAGCWSRDIAAMVDVTLPNTPIRHEILVTEALKPFLHPMIVDLRNGLYASQDMRGELVCGLGTPGEKPGIHFTSSLDFTRRLAKSLLDLLPHLGNVNILRQWSGAYDVTPDNKPILGPTPGLENFLQLNGASGHGFMISPMTTRLTANHILNKPQPHPLKPYLLERFTHPDYQPQTERMVIG